MLVSILIPCHNTEPWIQRAIGSALAQTWTDKEIIVLDDGSTDQSLSIIQRYTPQIQIAIQPNRGQNAARNHLTEIARGEWLVYLDADDELAPDSIEKKMACRDGVDAVYGSKEVVTFRGGERVESTKVIAQEHADPFVAAFQWKYPNTSSFLFRKQAVLTAGGWDEKVQNCTDYSLYFRMLVSGFIFGAAPGAWSLYRQWSETQAVNIAPLRKMMTRLRVMQEAAKVLENGGQLFSARRQAFLDASFGVIRTIYPHDSELARAEHARLLEWDRRFFPSTSVFPSNYVRTYQLFGFAAAERIAAWKRNLFPAKHAAQPF